MDGVYEYRGHADNTRILAGPGFDQAPRPGGKVALAILVAIIGYTMVLKAILGGPPDAEYVSIVASPIATAVADSTPTPTATPFVSFVPIPTPTVSLIWQLGCQSVGLSYNGLSEPPSYYHFDPNGGRSIRCINHNIDAQHDAGDYPH